MACNIDNCSSASYCLVSHAAFDGSYPAYVVETCNSSTTGTPGFYYVGTMSPEICGTSFSVAPSSIPECARSSGIYACTTAPVADYSTVPDFAHVTGSSETAGRFCPCGAPSYVSMAPPFCWSSSQAAMCGSYRCGTFKTPDVNKKD